MIINAQSASVDRQFNSDTFGHKGIENLLTLGAGSYIVKCDLTFFSKNISSPHILAGRFNSWASGINVSVGGNHPMGNVTSFPFDVQKIIDKVFGGDNPQIKPLSYKRPNHFQVIVGHDVWIGKGVTIMGGVKIGNGAVIGAKTVVAKDIPPYAIAVGNPARVVKYRFDEETIKKFLAVKWWNWDLKKVADNIPLMNDVEKFLAAHYSPELEEFPKDDFSRQIMNCDAKRFYHFIPDFEAQNPLWLKVVQDFSKANLETAALVIWLGKDATEENSQALTEAVGDSKNILVFKHDKNFSPAALRKATHFITTREMTTLEALDYLWNTDVKIVSALDNNIFGR